ncbi:MAG: radical SAM protein [Bacteroidetes bacterium]|nr:radical SAM protein [Bacteroidota bacterium]
MNQLTYFDRLYNETGADFLTYITREPQKVDDIVESLTLLYDKDTDYSELQAEFQKFLKELEQFMFVTTGETLDEIDQKEPVFSYNDNPKTKLRTFIQTFDEFDVEETSELLLQKSIENPQLSCLELEITTRCNERCVHCYIPNERKNKGGNIPLHAVVRAMEQARELNCLEVSISGGDPLLHKDFSTILHYAHKCDFKITVLSNLVALSEDHIRIFKNLNIGLVQVSLYSMNEQEHDAITNLKGSFIKTKANIERLVANNIPVQISCPTMKGNYHSYKDVLSYADKMQTKSQTDFVLMAQSDFNKQNIEHRLSDHQTKELLKDIMKYDKQYTNDILCQPKKSDNAEEYMQRPLCGVGLGMICIGYNWDVYPCAGWQGYIVGNIINESLEDIWTKSEKLQFLRAIKMKDFPDCISCNSKDYCSLCLVRNFNENNGDMLKVSESHCRAAKLNRQIVEESKK